MCLAVPFKIIKIDGLDAVAERGGFEKKIRVDFIPDPKIGDYVMVHAGFAIERLDAERAREDLEIYEEVENEIRQLYARRGRDA